jgi:cytochrome b involved in lipid metabolism
VHDLLISALARAARLDHTASKAELERAAAAEAAHPGTEPALLEQRLGWLERGTSPLELETLDPVRDSDRIYHHLLCTFRAESRLAETLAINRVATWESLALFLRSTGEAEQRPLPRFFDTYALFANFFEWGEHSQRGSAAVRRINQIHGRYHLPADGMKYVLLNTAFTWLDSIDRIGHRPLSELEREGFFQAHLRLGRAMMIDGLSADREEMYAWFRAINARNAFHTAFKTDTFETFVGNSFGAALRERDLLIDAARVAMDEQYRAALGYAAPGVELTRSVRSAVLRVAEQVRALARPSWVRSLEATPFRSAGSRPEELGVSERSVRLPATSQDLPVYAWDEIRRHRSATNVWLVIDGEVYDVSAFAAQHPGGAERLYLWAGRDATAAFGAAAHSQATRVLRLNYRIGRVLEAAPAEPDPEDKGPAAPVRSNLLGHHEQHVR